MAAKRKRKQKKSLSPWIVVILGLVIALAAAFVWLRDGGESGGSAVRGHRASDPGRGISEAQRDHDRDQIDQQSRDQLREILRASGDSGGSEAEQR